MIAPLTVGVVFFALEGLETILQAKVAECIENEMVEGEFTALLPRLERGEVVLLLCLGGLRPYACAWMDTTGDGNDILTAERAFAIARGEMERGGDRAVFWARFLVHGPVSRHGVPGERRAYPAWPGSAIGG